MTNRFTRSIAGRLGGVLLAWLAAFSAAPATAAERASSSPSPITLSVVLPAHHLPALAERVMKKELVRIWAHERVQITWRTTEGEVPAGDRFVRLTLIGNEERSFRSADQYVLGDFLPEEGRIRVSLYAASQAAANSSLASRRTREPFAYPLALGYVLGRAIAHEVGHALLGTEHAEAGLMQAAFDPRDMAESPSARFRLTAAESARLLSDRFEARTARESALATGVTSDTASLGPASTR